MRSTIVRFLVVAALAAGLAACGSSDSSSGGSTTSTTATTAPNAGATVMLVANDTIGEPILVDAKGMTLYVWDNDNKAGEASCTGECATAWPPLVVSGTATYGPGLDAGAFSTVTGPNGEDQLAVNGKPLYLWASDAEAGDATGQGVNGFYVVGSDGTKIDDD